MDDPYSPPAFTPPILPGRATPGQGQPPPAPPDACESGSCGAQISGGVQQNQQQLQQLNNLISGADLATNLSLLGIMNGKLDAINSKLGNQIPGGIGGFLGKMSKLLQLGRILNLLTFITTLHNAFMLSNGITQSLFEAFDNVLAIFHQELKDESGEEIDTSQFVSGAIENLFKQIFGAATVEAAEANFKKWNRIYQAASNLMFSVQSIGRSILDALEVVGGWNAAIGNALKKFGVVGERAYSWMNPTPNFQNRFFTALGQVQEIADSLEEITGNVRDVTETVSDMQTQKTELDAAIRDGVGTPTPENSTTANAAAASHQASATPPIAPADQTPPTPST